MKKAKLLERIEAVGWNSGDYHDSATIVSVLDTVLTQYNSEEEDIQGCNEVEDAITETCDSDTPIYYQDIAEWFGKNWRAYDEVREALGLEGMGDDIMKGIQIAYCITLEREVREELEWFLEEAEEEEAEAENVTLKV